VKTYKQVVKKEIDDVICDCCGQSCDTINMGPSWANLGATWGYGCKDDGMNYDIDICENCFIDVLDFIKEKRRKILGPFKYPYDYDPLEGKNYL
jgi:hypothetical protein